MLRMIIRGITVGLLTVMFVAIGDALWSRGNPFGLRTGIVGLLAGGMVLLMGLAMAVTSYWLARQNKAVIWRRRLLNAAVICGAAGLTCSLSATGLWAVAGQPFFP